MSAAISLTDALQEIASAYRATGEGEVRFNFAGSNVLARQIVNGAPSDLFISADEAQMEYVQRTGAIDVATRIPLLGNRLAIVTAPGATPVTDVQALRRVRRIAIGDPAAVPAGVYARQFLEAAGMWEALQPRLLTLGNVRAALAAVESGGAAAAIVYESDAHASRRIEIGFVVTGPHAPRIVYPAAVVSRSKNDGAARRFLEFLRGPQARQVFERHRFVPMSGRSQ